MLPLPSLPTDSLYKFLFVAGVVILIYSSYQQQNFKESYAQAESTIDSLDIVKDYKTLSFNRWESKANSEVKTALAFLKEYDSLKRINVILPAKFKDIDIKKAGYRKWIDTKVREVDSIREVNELDSKERALQLARLKSNNRFYDNQVLVTIMYMIIGFLMFILGAKNWLIYIQKPQDEIIQNELKLSRLQLQREILNSPNIIIDPPTLPVKQNRWNRIWTYLDSEFKL